MASSRKCSRICVFYWFFSEGIKLQVAHLVAWGKKRLFFDIFEAKLLFFINLFTRLNKMTGIRIHGRSMWRHNGTVNRNPSLIQLPILRKEGERSPRSELKPEPDDSRPTATSGITLIGVILLSWMVVFLNTTRYRQRTGWCTRRSGAWSIKPHRASPSAAKLLQLHG